MKVNPYAEIDETEEIDGIALEIWASLITQWHKVCRMMKYDELCDVFTAEEPGINDTK